jgi:hypothetical protein
LCKLISSPCEKENLFDQWSRKVNLFHDFLALLVSLAYASDPVSILSLPGLGTPFLSLLLVCLASKVASIILEGKLQHVQYFDP